MAYDPRLAEQLRAALRPLLILEKKMFGGLCFLHQGNMICGVHRGGALFRVGKSGYAEALDIAGVRPMQMGSKTMGGFVEATEEATADPDSFSRLMAQSRAFVKTLPPK